MCKEKILNILKQELIPSIGCTEPIAIALAAALARKYAAGEKAYSINVKASPNVIKNAMCVGIPGTNGTGINLAASLGVLANNSDKNLEVLIGINKDDIENAKEMINRGVVTVETAKTSKKLYIEVEVKTEKSTSRVVLEDTHTNVVLIEVDGKIIKSDANSHFIDNCDENNENDKYDFLDIDKIWKFTTNCNLDDLDIVKESIKLNMAVAEEGLAKPYGLQVGRVLNKNVKNGLLKDDISTHIMALTSSGSDARMDGCVLPVMSNSGSGNQGITATVPVVALGKRQNCSDEVIHRAVTLSHLITIYIKIKFGRLSALCGAAVAAMGASAGITYMLGYGLEEIKSTLQNMLGNITGMLCDGAKTGCSLKVSTCVSAAIQSALLSGEGITINDTDGIIAKDVEDTIDNLCRISNQGALEADKIILDILMNKNIC